MMGGTSSSLGEIDFCEFRNGNDLSDGLVFSSIWDGGKAF